MANTQEITSEIKQEICVIKEQPSGWCLECNLVSWNGEEPKIDIRPWNPEHTRCGKGVSLTVEEMQVVMNALNDLQIMEV